MIDRPTDLELLNLRLIEHGEDVGRVAVRALTRLLLCLGRGRHYSLACVLYNIILL